MRSVLTIVLIAGLLSAVYLLRVFDADKLASQNESSLPTVAEDAGQSDAKQGLDSQELIESAQERDAAPPPSPAAVWRPRPETALHWTEYQAKSYMDLRSLAEAGDGRAAAWLAALLAQCRNLPPPQTSAEVDASIDEIRRTHLVPTYSNGVATMQDFNNHLDSLEANIEVYETRARTCSGVPADHRVEWDDWAQRAVSTSHMDDLAHTLLAESMEKDDYVQLLSDLWKSGEPTALVSLSAVNLLDYHKGTNPHGQIHQFAYQLAALNLLRDYYDEFDISPNSNGLAEILSDDIQHLRGQMRQNEIREAEELAEELIEENQNCCLIWPVHFFEDE